VCSSDLCTTACSRQNRATTCSVDGPDCHKRRRQALPYSNHQPDTSRIVHVEQADYEMSDKTIPLKV